MGFIYLATNLINNKKYIGLTTKTVKERWNRHIYDAMIRKDDFYFHRAIRKYGIENFKVEEIEECPDNKLAEKEKFYIKHYNSFYKNKNGYNLTLGGDGLSTVDYEKIFSLWKQGLSAKEISNILEVHAVTVCNFLKKNKISSEEIKSRSAHFGKRDKEKKIYQYDFKGNLINIYSSVKEMNLLTGYSKDYIAATCRKQYPSANGYIWVYEDEEDILSLINKVPLEQKVPVFQYNLEGELVQEFVSVSEASRLTGIEKTAISHVINNENCLTAGGFFWSKNSNKNSILEKINRNNNKYEDRKRKVQQFDKNGNFIKEYESITEAAKAIGKENCRSSISKVCLGKQKTSCGFKWKYSD